MTTPIPLVYSRTQLLLRDLNMLGEWAKRNLNEFDKGNYQILPLRQTNPLHQYQLRSSSTRKALRL